MALYQSDQSEAAPPSKGRKAAKQQPREVAQKARTLHLRLGMANL